MARIDYGRVDYGFLDGRLQVWEINTNPVLLTTPLDDRDPRREVKARYLRCLAAALHDIAGVNRP